MLGLDCTAYYNSNTWLSPTWVEITCIEEFRRSFAFDEAGSDSRLSRIKTVVKTMIGLEYSGRLKKRLDDDVYAELYSVMMSDEPIDLLILDASKETEGAKGFRGYFHILSSTESQGLGDRLYDEITIKPADPADVDEIIQHATVGSGPGYTIDYDDMPLTA